MTDRPAWQRYLILIATILIVAALFWVGLVFMIAFAVLAVVVAIVNKIKVKLTGRPLFAGPKHFHRYQTYTQSQSRPQSPQHNVIEGEVVDRDKQDN